MPTGIPKRKRTKAEIAASIAKRRETIALNKHLATHSKQPLVHVPESDRSVALRILAKILEL